MSSNPPGSSDLLDRHEHLESVVNQCVLFLEAQPETRIKESKDQTKIGAISPEAREIIRELKEHLEKPSTFEFMTVHDFEHYAKKKLRESLLKIRKLADKKKDPNKDKQKQSQGGQQRRMMGNVEQKDITEKGLIVKQTTANTTKGNNPAIQRGGFGRNSTTTASDEPDKTAGQSTRPQTTTSLPPPTGGPRKIAAGTKRTAIGSRTISRGGNSPRVFVPPDKLSKTQLAKQHAKAFRIGFQSGYKQKKEELAKAKDAAKNKTTPEFDKLVALGKPEVDKINKPLYDRMREEAEIERRADAMGREEIRKLNRTLVENQQQDALIAHKANKIGLAEVEALNRGEPYGDEIEVEGGDEDDDENYDDRGKNTPDRRGPRRLKGRGPQSRPSQPQPSSGVRPGGGGSGNRRPPPTRRRGGLGKSGANAAKLGGQLARTGAMAARAGAFFATPAGWITIGVIILLILIILILFIISGEWEEAERKAREEAERCQTPQETLSVVKSGPTEATNGQTLQYTITVKDTLPAQELTIVDRLPEGISLNPADIQSSWPGFTFDPAQKTITWKATPQALPPNANLSPPNFTFTVTLKANAANAHLLYILDSTPVRGGAGPGGGGAPPAGSPEAEAKWQEVLKLGEQYGPTWIEFLNAAREVSQQEDYPLAVIIAQGAHESAHGTSPMSRTKKNFFGFMAYDANTDAARAYPTAADSIRDYVKLIKTGNGGKNKSYLDAYANRADPRRMVELIKAGGYATDEGYVRKVTSVREFEILVGVALPGGGTQPGCPPAQGGSSAEYLPPSDNNCNGKYVLNNPLNKNFGDPDCSFNKDDLLKRLQQKDPENANWWFVQVIPCESGANPNAFNPNTPDPQGGWGLVQTGSSGPPGQPPPGNMRPDYSDPHDRGDVSWKIQIDNATELLKKRGKGYWACR